MARGGADGKTRAKIVDDVIAKTAEHTKHVTRLPEDQAYEAIAAAFTESADCLRDLSSALVKTENR